MKVNLVGLLSDTKAFVDYYMVSRCRYTTRDALVWGTIIFRVGQACAFWLGALSYRCGLLWTSFVRSLFWGLHVKRPHVLVVLSLNTRLSWVCLLWNSTRQDRLVSSVAVLGMLPEVEWIRLQMMWSLADLVRWLVHFSHHVHVSWVLFVATLDSWRNARSYLLHLLLLLLIGTWLNL